MNRITNLFTGIIAGGTIGIGVLLGGRTSYEIYQWWQHAPVVRQAHQPMVRQAHQPVVEIRIATPALADAPPTLAPTTVPTPTDGSTGSPTDGSTGSPTDGSTGSPTDGSTGSPTDGSTGSPTDGSTGLPTDGSTGSPTGKVWTESISAHEKERIAKSIREQASAIGRALKEHRKDLKSQTKAEADALAQAENSQQPVVEPQPIYQPLPAPVYEQPVQQPVYEPPPPSPVVVQAVAADAPLVAIPLPTAPPDYQFAPTPIPANWSATIPQEYIGCVASSTGGFDCPNGEHIKGFGPDGVYK